MAGSEAGARVTTGAGFERPEPESDRSFAEGFLVGVLIGEGHFGGDGKQPQVTLRMHTRHESLFRWIESNFPGGKLYGPYLHSGRNYMQWMARGDYLRETILPILERRLTRTLDEKAFEAVQTMKSRYHMKLVNADSSPETSVREPDQAAERDRAPTHETDQGQLDSRAIG